MRAWLPLALVALALGAVVYLTEDAQASTNCHATGNWCQGYAQVSTKTGGVLGTDERCFALRLTNTAPTCAAVPSNEAGWEVNAGSCQTLYYYDVANGATAPAVPNKVWVYSIYDTAAAGAPGGEIDYLNAGTEPANGASYTFCATSTGAAGGAARSGTWQIGLRLAKDNGIGGVGNYDINSWSNQANCASVGAASTCDRGALRALVTVSSIARGAYPAGSTFAYGSGGNEQVTVTATYPQPYAENNVEALTTGLLDSATHLVGSNGGGVDVDTGSLAQSVTIDTTNTPFSGSPYVPVLTVTGNAALTGLPWTGVATTGNGANIVRFSATTAYDSTTFNVDPRIRLDSDGVGTFATADETDKSYVGTCTGGLVELYNKGETVCHEWYIFNARAEQLTRAMTHARLDGANTQCATYGSLTPSAGKYTKTDTLSTGSTCLAVADTTGSTRHLRVTNTGQSYDSGTTFRVSSLLRFDQDGSGTPDNLLVTCLGANGCPGATVRVFNRGFERVDFEAYLINARGTQYQATGVTFRSADSTDNQANSQTISHSSGKYSGADFALSNSELSTADTTGDAHGWTATKDGNTATSVAYVYGVSRLLFLDAHIELSGTLVKDNFPTENSAEDTAYIISNAVTDTTHGWCHVVGVRKDFDVDTSGAVITWSYIDPLAATRLSGTTDTGADGWTPTHLDLLASTPLGSWTFRCAITSFSGNAGTNDQVFSVSVPTGSSGGAGDPMDVNCASIIRPSASIRCTVSLANTDGSARSGAAAHVFIDVYNPSNTVVVTGGAVTEIGTTGVYRYTYSVGASPATGIWLVVGRTDDTNIVTRGATVSVETDGTAALATSLATALSDLGLIKGYTDQVEGYTDTLEAGQATAVTAHSNIQADTDDLQISASHADAHHHAIEGYVDQVEGYTDTLEGSAATAAAAHAAASAAHSSLQADTDDLQVSASHADAHHHTIEANQAIEISKLDYILTRVNGVDANLNATRGEILDAIANLNLTVDLALSCPGGNETGNETVCDILVNEIREHREHSLELTMNNDFAGLGYDGFLFAVAWFFGLIFFLSRAKVFAAISCTIGICVSLFLSGFGPWTHILAGLQLAFFIWLEAIARDRIYQRLFPQKPSSQEPIAPAPKPPT